MKAESETTPLAPEPWATGDRVTTPEGRLGTVYRVELVVGLDRADGTVPHPMVAEIEEGDAHNFARAQARRPLPSGGLISCSSLSLAGGERVPSEGWRFAPLEPTPEMIEAGMRTVSFEDGVHGEDNGDDEGEEVWTPVRIYRAMLSAAPAPTSQPPLHLKNPPPGELGEVDLLDQLAADKTLTLEYSYGPEPDGDGRWTVHRVRGNVNDREWELVGEGQTPRDALLVLLGGRGNSPCTAVNAAEPERSAPPASAPSAGEG